MEPDSTQPTPQPDLTPAPQRSLADTHDLQEERGRIGYGRHERTSSWMLGAALVLIVLGIGVYQFVQSRHADDPGKRVEVPIEGKPAPDFTLTSLDGQQTFSLASQLGKVVVLNFWGSWCAPCREEMPALQQFAASAPDDVEVVGISAKQDSLDAARSFVHEHGVTYLNLRDDGGKRVTQGDVSIAYGINFYPMTYFIDKDGVVSSVVVQSLTTKDLKYYVDRAEKATAGELPPIWIRQLDA